MEIAALIEAEMNEAKSIVASFLTVVSWIGALSAQEIVTFALATVLTILSIVFVVYGIRNRRIEHKIKQAELEELSSE